MIRIYLLNIHNMLFFQLENLIFLSFKLIAQILQLLLIKLQVEAHGQGDFLHLLLKF
jgi:hypothetical protein